MRTLGKAEAVHAVSAPPLSASVPFRVVRAGGELACWRTGRGEVALLLHGGPGISDYTEPLAVELAGSLGMEGGALPATRARSNEFARL